MTTFRIFAAALVISFVAAACDDDNDTDVCAKERSVAKSLNCTATEAQINESCNALLALAPPACKSQMDKLKSCITGLPTSSFECNAAGTVSLKPAACSTETNAVVICATADGGTDAATDGAADGAADAAADADP